MGESASLDRELIEECGELLRDLRADLPSIRGHAADKDVLARMQGRAHNAKGLIGFLGDPEMTDLASRLTETLRRLRDGETELTQDSVDEIAARTTKLTEFLAAAEIPAGPSGPDAALPLALQATRTMKVLPEAEKTTAGTDGSSWDELQISACRERVEAFSKAVAEVLGAFDVGGVVCAEDHPGELLATTHDLTVLVNADEPLEAAIIFEFDRDVARSLARKIATAMAGEQVEVTSQEEAELVRGVLGEVVNFTLYAALSALGLPPMVAATAAAPQFADGKGVRLSAYPRAMRRFSVETELGSFGVGYVPGAALSEDLDAPSEQAEGGLRSRGTVVVADDSLIMRKMIERLLVGAGYEVVAHAKNGREAIEQFRRHRPVLVTMDINMPVMGGLDALRIIRAEDPTARVLIVSAVNDDGTRRHGLASGAVGYITKPFDPAEFIETVEHLLKQREMEAGSSRAQTAAPLVTGSLGIYRVGNLLGEGGMAAVYEAEDPGLGRKVALKMITERYADDVDFVVRFLKEARAVAKVNHPNVVTIYFAGSDKGKHFFVMELLPGPDLADFVDELGPLAEREALSYLRQGALGLAAAARQGLIHCDVKPSNLVFGSDGILKVADFGIARPLGTKDNPTISEVMGTPWYMAPEQVKEQSIDHRTDIYSLGATLHFLLTGDPPYDGDDAVEVALRQVHDPVPSLPQASRKVRRLLARMMAKAPEARHESYDSLLSDINRLL